MWFRNRQTFESVKNEHKHKANTNGAVDLECKTYSFASI